MKALLSVAIVLSLTGCIGGVKASGKKSVPIPAPAPTTPPVAITDPAGIENAILGSWEIVSWMSDDQTFMIDRPQSNQPYAQRNIQAWTQFKIDQSAIQLISTDFVEYSTLSTTYSIEGMNVITKNTKSDSMPDFTVINYSANMMMIEFLDKTGVGDGVRWNLARITESQLATKSALTVYETQAIAFNATSSKFESFPLNYTVSGRPDLSADGSANYISCSMADGGLQVSFDVLQASKGVVTYDSTKPALSYTLIGFIANLGGGSSYVNYQSPVSVIARSGSNSYISDFLHCSQSVRQTGAVLDITSNCTGGKDGVSSTTLTAKCLLILSDW